MFAAIVINGSIVWITDVWMGVKLLRFVVIRHVHQKGVKIMHFCVFYDILLYVNGEEKTFLGQS